MPLTVKSLTRRIGVSSIAMEAHDVWFTLASESPRFAGMLPEEYDPNYPFTTDDIAYLVADVFARHTSVSEVGRVAIAELVYGLFLYGE